MKKTTRSLFALCLLSFALGCEKEEALPMGTATESAGAPVGAHFALLKGGELPPGILTATTGIVPGLQGKSPSDKGPRFGEIDTDRAHLLRSAGGATYTLGLKNRDAGLYYDNLVLAEKGDGQVGVAIVRYEPVAEWYGRLVEGTADYGSYSGGITFYDVHGAKLHQEHYANGALLAKRDNGKTGRDSTYCAISIGQEAGLLQNGTFYVYSISYNLHCYTNPTGGGVQTGITPTGHTFFPTGGTNMSSAPVGPFSPDDRPYVTVAPPPPPSCKSFKFARIGTLNFQYSYVKGIQFLSFTKNGDKVFVEYKDPIQFGAPYKDRFNNIYKPADLAEASALALQEAMDNTFASIKTNSLADTGRAKQIFEAELIRIYPNYVPGGRVVVRPTSLNGHTPTPYVAAWFGNGNCD